jgi:drug/metabolite transporter (DMT)-like permease
MNLMFYLLYIFSGIATSLPVVVCREFYSQQNFDIKHILIFVTILIILWATISWLLYYYVVQDIKIGHFYVIIKLLEIVISIVTSIYFYKETYDMYNYVGMFFTFLSLVLVSI